MFFQADHRNRTSGAPLGGVFLAAVLTAHALHNRDSTEPVRITIQTQYCTCEWARGTAVIVRTFNFTLQFCESNNVLAGLALQRTLGGLRGLFPVGGLLDGIGHG